MSDNKFQPGEEIFDETQGHARARIVADDEATEGHGGKFPLTDEDTEGHMPRIRIPLAEDEETEGNSFRGGLVEGDDDTEGHRYSGF